MIQNITVSKPTVHYTARAERQEVEEYWSFNYTQLSVDQVYLADTWLLCNKSELYIELLLLSSTQNTQNIRN